MYETERWSLKKLEETKLIVMERKILRTFFGAVKDERTDEWGMKKKITSHRGLFRNRKYSSRILQ